jgi:hypothetical protein
MIERQEKIIHIRIPGQEGTTLIVQPELAREVWEDILRRNSTQGTENRGRNPQPEKGSSK